MSDKDPYIYRIKSIAPTGIAKNNEKIKSNLFIFLYE